VWVLTLTLLTCLSIDFSNPLLPGVVRFDDSESVYAVRAERSRTDERTSTASLLPVLGSRAHELVMTTGRATSPVVEGRRPVSVVARPRGLSGAPSASPPTTGGDDH
jgi:hypothetical protein